MSTIIVVPSEWRLRHQHLEDFGSIRACSHVFGPLANVGWTSHLSLSRRTSACPAAYQPVPSHLSCSAEPQTVLPNLRLSYRISAFPDAPQHVRQEVVNPTANASMIEHVIALSFYHKGRFFFVFVPLVLKQCPFANNDRSRHREPFQLLSCSADVHLELTQRGGIFSSPPTRVHFVTNKFVSKKLPRLPANDGALPRTWTYLIQPLKRGSRRVEGWRGMIQFLSENHSASV